MFALNTSFDATLFLLGPRLGPTEHSKSDVGPDAIQCPKGLPMSGVEKFRGATGMRKRARRTYRIKPDDIVPISTRKRDTAWLYIPKVQTGLSKKLAHLWHGPFRIDEVLDDFRVKLKVDSTGYRVNPWVHISRLKPRVLFPKRPTVTVDVDEEDDFDAALLPEDSWEADVQKDEYEVEKILDLRWSKKTWISKRRRSTLSNGITMTIQNGFLHLN
ncbi:hypothetical protein PHMEG_00032632 [Phytophthora megakarya]|uniref:Uncharacterized protein n=1 Tax=Phytophthora megakarya TaxID=4795 RepID=A0A225UXH3_9STRA|nr:hypothetical protein PHMEG_00032632 [Phytophthora megakarya]